MCHKTILIGEIELCETGFVSECTKCGQSEVFDYQNSLFWQKPTQLYFCCDVWGGWMWNRKLWKRTKYLLYMMCPWIFFICYQLLQKQLCRGMQPADNVDLHALSSLVVSTPNSPKELCKSANGTNTPTKFAPISNCIGNSLLTDWLWVWRIKQLSQSVKFTGTVQHHSLILKYLSKIVTGQFWQSLCTHMSYEIMTVCAQHSAEEKVQFVLSCHDEEVLMSENVLHVPSALIILAFTRFFTRVICDTLMCTHRSLSSNNTGPLQLLMECLQVSELNSKCVFKKTRRRFAASSGASTFE